MDKLELYRKLIIEKIEKGTEEIEIDKFMREAKSKEGIEKSLNELIAEKRIRATLVIGEMGELSARMFVDMDKVEKGLLEELTKDYKAYDIEIKVAINENVNITIGKEIIRNEMPSKKMIKECLEGSRVIKDIKIKALKGNLVDFIREKGEK